MNSARKFGDYLGRTSLGHIHMNPLRPDLRMFSYAWPLASHLRRSHPRNP
jgi:DUF1680 family protein